MEKEKQGKGNEMHYVGNKLHKFIFGPKHNTQRLIYNRQTTSFILEFIKTLRI